MKMDTDTDEFKFIPTIQGLQVMNNIVKGPQRALVNVYFMRSRLGKQRKSQKK